MVQSAAWSCSSERWCSKDGSGTQLVPTTTSSESDVRRLPPPMKRDHLQPAVPGNVNDSNPSEASRLQRQTNNKGLRVDSRVNSTITQQNRSQRNKTADLHVAISSKNRTLVARIAPLCTTADVRTPFRGMTALSLAVFNADCEIVKVSTENLSYKGFVT